MSPIEFDAVLEPLVWGRSTYTIIRVPDDVVAAAAAADTHRVAGTVEGHEVNLALNKADVLDDVFVWSGATLQRRLGLKPGDAVHCRLAPVDPDLVPVPDDVHEALALAGAEGAFEALRPGERRRLLVPVEDAVRPDTRRRRVDALVAAILTGP